MSLFELDATLSCTPSTAISGSSLGNHTARPLFFHLPLEVRSSPSGRATKNDPLVEENGSSNDTFLFRMHGLCHQWTMGLLRCQCTLQCRLHLQAIHAESATAKEPSSDIHFRCSVHNSPPAKRRPDVIFQDLVPLHH
mmetsp:Transcript_3786/g.6997  ORF Transcript_3786/g.6997 Transcript_3786/m.6997 type:complete len:138 (+) Transcript_3786:71-484(+)